MPLYELKQILLYIWYLMMFDLSELCCAMTTHNVLCAIPFDQPRPLYQRITCPHCHGSHDQWGASIKSIDQWEASMSIRESHVPIVMEVMTPPLRPPHLQSNQRAGGGGFRDWMHKMPDWFISSLRPGCHFISPENFLLCWENRISWFYDMWRMSAS